MARPRHKNKPNSVTVDGLRLEQNSSTPQFSNVFKGLAPTFYLNDARQQHKKQIELLSQAQVILAQKQLTDGSAQFDGILDGEVEIVLTDSLSPSNKEKITTKKQIRKAAKGKVAAFEKRAEQKSKREKKAKNTPIENSNATLTTSSSKITQANKSKPSERKTRSNELFDAALKKLTGEIPIKPTQKHSKPVNDSARKSRPPIDLIVGKDDKKSFKLDKNQVKSDKNQTESDKSEFTSQVDSDIKVASSVRAVKKLKEVYQKQATSKGRIQAVDHTDTSTVHKIIDEQLIPLEVSSSVWRKIYRGSVLKLRESDFVSLKLPKEIAEHRKVVVFEINQENRYIVTKLFNSYYTLPFSCFEYWVSRPIRYAEKELSLSTLSGFYKVNFKNSHSVDNDLSRYYIRWFTGSVLVADFIGTMPNVEFSVIVKDEVLYRDRFARFVGRFTQFIEQCGIKLADYSLEPIVGDKAKLAVVFSLIADYIINKEYYYSNLKTYLQKTVVQI